MEKRKEDILKDVYYDPKTGLVSIEKLFQRVKKHGITRADIKKFIAEQDVAQVHKKVAKPIYSSIYASGVDHIWQADLCDMAKYCGSNSNYKFLLCIVDVYSRYAFVFPMKSKNKNVVVSCFIQLFAKRKPRNLTTDLGSKFNNKEMKALLNRVGVKHYMADVADHTKMGLVERFNRTLKTLISRYMTAAKTRKYIEVLPDLVTNYNTTHHQFLGKPPADVRTGDYKITKEPAGEEFRKFTVGDRVRLLQDTPLFQKGYVGRWSKGVYEIADVENYKFVIANSAGKILDKRYKHYELQKVNKEPTPETVVPFAKMTRSQKEVARELAELNKADDAPKVITRKLRSEKEEVARKPRGDEVWVELPGRKKKEGIE